MKFKYILPVIFSFQCTSFLAQENMMPATKQQQAIAITNATIHVGNGTVINNGSIVFENGVIKEVNSNATLINKYANLKTIDAFGKHVYPGIIAASTNLGLVEIASTKSTIDSRELGDFNPSVKSLVAYNTDSKVINTLRSNGVLLAHIVPEGGTISGTSSVVQLDAWNWEDAAYATNNGMHINLPMLLQPPSFGGRGGRGDNPTDVVAASLKKIEEIEQFFAGAKAYFKSDKKEVNLKYDALKDLFDKKQKLFVHCDLVKEMYMAINWKIKYDIDVVIVGGSDSWIIATQLADAKIPVILSQPHSLPAVADDAVNLPYMTGFLLQNAGVLFTICQDASDGFWQQRCLPFQAGTMVANGLDKEQALQAITLNAAKILGIDNKTGSLTIGKDANIVISTGDILDMMSSNVTNAFIQGRTIDLNNKQTDLFNKYKAKYEIK
jgi:imidazolonepropionase-like amidohydrolase